MALTGRLTTCGQIFQTIIALFQVQEALLKQEGVDVNDRATGSGSTAIHYTATTVRNLRILILFHPDFSA